ncbi:Uncharacterized protein ALO48_00023 [Pseudomonas syringae pv. rhaphiolepidis]|nr:Uncharacterized protein ALO48_00023 [Pseudomonas syringae pv. rhaphiolepidis]
MKQELDAAVVNAGCLLFFPTSQQVAPKNDVLDSMLYVQLAASKQHPRFAEFGKWNETRLAAALRFGWVLNASEHVSEPLPEPYGVASSVPLHRQCQRRPCRTQKH